MVSGPAGMALEVEADVVDIDSTTTIGQSVLTINDPDASAFSITFDGGLPGAPDETNDKNPTTFGRVRGNLEIGFWIQISPLLGHRWQPRTAG